MKAKFFQKAKRITVPSLRKNLSRVFKSSQTYFVTEKGKPAKVLIPYDSLFEFLEILEELDDKTLLRQVAQGRKEYQKGREWIPVSRLFNQIRKSRLKHRTN